MKAFLLAVACVCCASAMRASPLTEDLIIWDDAPATDWDTAYPVGNGRLGAMPFGAFPNERILINEETIWERGSPKAMPEDSHAHLESIRELEAARDYHAADRYFEQHLQDESRPDSYQLVGWLNLEFRNTSALKNTHRELNLKTGVARNEYTLADGSTISQEVFVASTDDVVAVSISGAQPFSLSVSMEGGFVENGDIVKTASGTGNEATRYVCRTRVRSDGATTPNQGALEVDAAKEITIYVSVATDFDRRNSGSKLPDGWQGMALQILDTLREKPVDQVKQQAIAEHRKYFDRVDVDFGTTPDEVLALPTRDRLQRLKDGKHDDPDLIETYFQFGRYLLIGSSRPGFLPANLQGVWNPHEQAPWGSDYHLNINIQMNYWLAETTNLSELHRPLFDFIRYLQPNGKDMARKLGMKGWCMGHATDVWGNARIMASHAYWGGSFFGGQWMTLHMLEHYRFNRDKQFLEENWDVLTDSVAFVDSWLIPGPEEGTLMARPSCSPENSFTYTDTKGETRDAALSAGNTFDQYMILQVFSDYLEAAEAIGKSDDAFVQKTATTMRKVYLPRIGDDGRLMEWRLPFGEKEPGHRHMSHVIGAYPGNQIDLDDDLVMRDGVQKTIEGRLRNGGAGTGWSRAWTIGMFARLSDEDRAYENLHAILTRSTLDNLWDTHPPFQIDGNFGSSATVAEMLLHSHNNAIKLLPAPPDQWPDGHVRGLRARGDYTVNVSWKDGELVEAVVKAGENASGTVKVVYRNQSKTLDLEAGANALVTPKSFTAN